MRISILKFVFFSIIICFFEYAKNELCLERNIKFFRNNRILADIDNQFDLSDFYQSTLSLVNRFNNGNDYNDGNDDNDYSDYEEEIMHLRDTLDSHIKMHKENNTSSDLNNVDNNKAKKLIDELRKELEEAKKELDNRRNGELEIQPLHNKRITKKNENIYVSEHEDFKQLEIYENVLENKNTNFEDKYNEITSKENYKKLKVNQNVNKAGEKILNKALFYIRESLVTFVSGWKCITVLFISNVLSLIKNTCKIVKSPFKSKKSRR
ncbi:hypothetical protein YYC_04143 [Plasmodium yoelii 17X]|uniref:Fam-b protein n=4 Tax=Plasmodium yoelii TaxID=5861 RepID=A0AAF0B668_PLAYO|nr:fam-b protein [Plasmodium yoelii]EAA18074.1 hypothetical protein [Plasmodium yoelii yoelii]ETB58054.1 hypothetical protein YYC_04143 [Plasmodium yoelii 17X]WBY59009.1 fam-b protein [Plasmodium yoelii yoelii]CDU19201.1 fam-b protein [Plasmodium yoelii]VTZ79836.1 fam-b protein [Plasmodium yoelii]|eukprot:XP_726509.1 fam-b protein [Plasmodium yoelii]